jgi:transmembrane sensor
VSEADRDAPVVSRAGDIEAQAAGFLERQVCGDASDEDRATRDAWLAQSWANRSAYLRLDAAWRRTDRLAALRRPDAADAASDGRGFAVILKVAAVLGAIAVLGLGAAAYFTRPQDRVYATPVGGHEMIAFADGSRIELSTDTVLRTRMTTAQRTVWLEKGEAYFQVKHNPADPFVVIAGNHRVVDLGTKFLIRRDPGMLEVALMDGRVRFEAPHSPSQSALLASGDVVTATTSTMFVTHESGKVLSNALAWRHGALVFDNTTLADAAAEFNRYNARKLIIADPAAARLTIVGKFRTGDVEPFARVIRNVLGLHVQARGDDFVISR